MKTILFTACKSMINKQPGNAFTQRDINENNTKPQVPPSEQTIIIMPSPTTTFWSIDFHRHPYSKSMHAASLPCSRTRYYSISRKISSVETMLSPSVSLGPRLVGSISQATDFDISFARIQERKTCRQPANRDIDTEPGTRTAQSSEMLKIILPKYSQASKQKRKNT